MLSFIDIKERDGALIFPDDTEPGTFWVLPMGASTEMDDDSFSGQLTLFGRGDADNPADVLGCFWNLSLRPRPLQDVADDLVVALSTEEHPARLHAVDIQEATVALTLCDDPLITETRTQDVWAGGQLAFGGQVAPELAGRFRKEWARGLKDARAEISLTFSGAEPPQTAQADAAQLDLHIGDGHLSIATATASVATSATQSGRRVLRFTIDLSPGRRAAKDKIILSGFDR